MSQQTDILIGGITNFSKPSVYLALAGRMPMFQLLGYDGHIRSGEQRCDVSQRDDASHLVMRTITASNDALVGSVVTVTGQIVVWCHNFVLYTASLSGYDGIWMAPLRREFFGDYMSLESDKWVNFWVSTSPPSGILGPDARLGTESPEPGSQLVSEADIRASGFCGSIDTFVCSPAGAVFFSSGSEIGCTFSRWGFESVVILPRGPLL